jgi:hypothetical protein
VPLVAPVAVPGYELLEELGRGGMGVVYKARQVKADRLVALKMILSGAHASAADLQRFRTEAEAVARLSHPNIVQVFEVGEHDGRPFFSMEYCPGGSLEKHLGGTPLPSAEAARLVQALAGAVQHAHAAGVVHRDLKPANVLLTFSREPEASAGAAPALASGSRLNDATPKISDFGLAKRLGEAGQTASGAVLGTPSYMAPEQAAGGSKEVGPAADVYALGAILYECLTGRPPFKAATPLDTILQVVADEPVPPSRLNPKVPRDLETVCLKCLEKRPPRRYRSAAALAEDLRRCREGEPIAARPAGALERAWKWCRRRPAVAALLAVCVVAAAALLGGGAWFTWQLSEKTRLAEQERDNARSQSARADAEEARTRRQLALTRRALQTAQLVRAGSLVAHDPDLAAPLLDDADLFPPGERDFTWAWYRRLSRLERFALNTDPSGKQGQLALRPLALSPDGDLLAAVFVRQPKEFDQRGLAEVRFLDPRTGEPRKPALPVDGWVVNLAFSPDGKYLALRREETISLHELATGKETVSPKEWLGPIRIGRGAMAFGPDGRLAARWGLGGDEVVLWKTPSFEESARVKLEGFDADGQSPGQIDCLAFRPDGKVLAIGSGIQLRGRLTLWDLAAGKAVATVKTHRAVQGLAFSPDGKTLAVGTALWDLERLAPLWAVPPAGLVSSVAFSPDGRTLAVGVQINDNSGRWLPGLVRLLDPVTGQQRGALEHADQVLGLAFSPDGEALATVNGNPNVPGEVRLFRTGGAPPDAGKR